MAEYIVYEEATGKILRTLQMPQFMAEVNVFEGEALLECPPPLDLGTAYVKEGVVLEMPVKPNPYYEFDYSDETWKDLRDVSQKLADFENKRKEALEQVLQISSEFEQKFVTPLPSQMEKYRRKEKDGADYLAAYSLDPAVDVSQFPWVAAEVGVTAPTAYEVAQIYVNLAYQWETIAFQYEPLRIQCVNEIELAESESEVDTSIANFKSALMNLITAIASQ